MWSLIAAAFIGPGTVATATRAGVQDGLLQLPTVAIAAFAGYLLMEMAARITIVTRRSLGSILRDKAGPLPTILFLAVAFGCIAYQAGNLLGALGGLQLILPVSNWLLVPLAGLIVLLLWSGNTVRVARYLAGIVAVMGIVFVLAATGLLVAGKAGTGGGSVDTATVIALVGTTIVPYNFFLASGLGSDQGLTEMRRGIFLSFLVGGIITAGILVVGSTVGEFTSFNDLAVSLDSSLSGNGGLILGIGLFVAGFSSATTAPLAAALAGRELLGKEQQRWKNDGRYFRSVWLTVLGIGLFVGLLRLDIIGVIVAAQVVNGVLLPLVALTIFVLANDRKLLGDRTNRTWQNLAGATVLLFLFYKNGQLLLGF